VYATIINIGILTAVAFALLWYSYSLGQTLREATDVQLERLEHYAACRKNADENHEFAWSLMCTKKGKEFVDCNEVTVGRLVAIDQQYKKNLEQCSTLLLKD